MPSLISSIAYARLSAPDLGVMRAFLEDFGFVLAHADSQRLYMRGTGDAPFLHVTERGEPGAVAVGYNVDDESVLQDLVKAGDAKSIDDVNEPGGGKRVLLREPNGLGVELIAGRKPIAPLPPRLSVRPSSGKSVREGPSRVHRIAHGVLATPILAQTLAWFHKNLRLIPTDELFVGTEDNLLGQFNRIDRGDELVDHHVLFVLKNKVAGLHHLSFEVDEPDDIFVGHDHLKRGRYEHIRGIGRHALGSQIFDYWMSPFEQMHEHWSSSERMNAQSAFNRIRIGEGMAHDHGEKPSERFVRHATRIIIPA